MKKIIQGSMIAFVGLYSASLVFAHVTVNPKTTIAGYSVATVRVPNEKDVATTQVRILVPEGVQVHGVMPLSGWTHAEKLVSIKNTTSEETSDHDDDDDHGSERISEIIWTGGKIGVGEFMDFPVSVQYPDTLEKVTWKAYQTYAGGEVVAWDGSNEKSPAPVVTVSQAVATEVNEKDNSMKKSQDIQTTWISVVALVLSVCAIALHAKKK